MKFALATAILKTETLRMRRRFARVSVGSCSSQIRHYKNAANNCNCLSQRLAVLPSALSLSLLNIFMSGSSFFWPKQVRRIYLCNSRHRYSSASYCMVLSAMKSTLRYSIVLNSPSARRRSSAIYICYYSNRPLKFCGCHVCLRLKPLRMSIVPSLPTTCLHA